jgi:hypothetical protein
MSSYNGCCDGEMINVNYQLPVHTGNTKKTCNLTPILQEIAIFFVRMWYTDGHSKVQGAPSGLLRSLLYYALLNASPKTADKA